MAGKNAPSAQMAARMVGGAKDLFVFCARMGTIIHVRPCCVCLLGAQTARLVRRAVVQEASAKHFWGLREKCVSNNLFEPARFVQA